MARITWQNVAAPDFSDALRGYELSGNAFGDAASQLSKALTGAAERGREKASTAAMARALQMRDVGGWDDLMQTQGLAGLGISADQATPAFMDFLRGYREDLATDRADDLANQRNIVGLNQAKLDLSQDGREFEQRFNWTEYSNDRTRTVHGREDDAFRRAEEDRLRNLEAGRIAQELAESQVDIGAAKQSVNLSDYDPLMEEAIMRSLQQLDPSKWATDPRLAGSATTFPEYQLLQEQLVQEEAESNFTNASDRILQAYGQGAQLKGSYDDPVIGLANSLRSNLTVKDGEDAESAFSRETGEIYNVFRELKSEFNLPDEVIASVMRNNLRGTGVDIPGATWIGDGQLKFNKNGIREELGAMDTPAERRKLAERQALVDRGIADRANRSALIEQYAATHDRLLTLGRPEEAAVYAERLRQMAAPTNPRDAIPAGGPLAPQAPAQATAPTNPLDNTPLNFGNVLQRAAMETGPQRNPPPAPDPGNGLPEIASQIANSSLNQEDKRTAGIVLQALDKGRDPKTGRPLSDEQRQRYEAQLLQLLAAAENPTAAAPNSFMSSIGSWFR